MPGMGQSSTKPLLGIKDVRKKNASGTRRTTKKDLIEGLNNFKAEMVDESVSIQKTCKPCAWSNKNANVEADGYWKPDRVETVCPDEGLDDVSTSSKQSQNIAH